MQCIVWDRTQNNMRRMRVHVCVCLSVCHRSCGRNFESNLIKLFTLAWGGKTKIYFVRGQSLIMPSPILPAIFPNLMHFQWDGLNTAVSTPVDRLWWLPHATPLGGR